MNSSAKLSFLFLGAVALGGVAFACTTTSGTDDDLDGGVNSSSSSSSTSSSSSSTSSSSSGGDELCPQYDAGFKIDSEDCNTCLLTNCCAQTAGCYDIPDGDEDAGDPLGCQQYLEGLQNCDDSPGNQSVNDCKGLIKSAANTAVPSAYNTYFDCRTTTCQAQCQGVSIPDGGLNTH